MKNQISHKLSYPSWIHSRESIFYKVFIDIFSVLLLIFSSTRYSWFSGNIESLISDFATLNVWIFLNYIFGKYSKREYKNNKTSKIIIFFLRIGISVFLIICALLFLLRPFLSNYFSTQDIINIFYISIVSLFLQTIYAIFSNKKNILNKVNWLVITNYKNYTLLKEIVERDPHTQRINLIFYDQNVISSEKLNGVIVDKNYGKVDLDLVCSRYLKSNIKILDLILWFELYFERIPIEFLDENLMNQFVTSKYKRKLYSFLKRIFDILVSLLILIFSSPILFLSILLIWIEDRGPAFYSQERSGLYLKILKIYKLRTMKVNAEEFGIQWSNLNDQRITKIGRILRKTRIDELPQLLNVLLGEMSLIGPRPERPVIDDELFKSINHYKKRYNIKPGLSGWAQVKYNYAASIEATKLKLSYDFFYLKNFSIWLDLLILFKTIRLVFNGEGSNPKTD